MKDCIYMHLKYMILKILIVFIYIIVKIDFVFHHIMLYMMNKKMVKI